MSAKVASASNCSGVSKRVTGWSSKAIVPRARNRGAASSASPRPANRSKRKCRRVWWKLTFHDRAVDLQQLWPGQQVWKSDDPALTRRLRKSFAGEIAGRDLPVHVAVTAAGRTTSATARASGRTCRHFACTSAEPLAAAIKHPLTVETLEKQLGRLGGTGFVLRQLTASIEGSPMVPLSVLGQLRHDMVGKLAGGARGRLRNRRTRCMLEPVLPALRQEIERPTAAPAAPQLFVLCRSLHQLQAMLEHDQPVVYVDFQDIREYRPAVAMARDQPGADLPGHPADPEARRNRDLSCSGASSGGWHPRQEPRGIGLLCQPRCALHQRLLAECGQ